MKTRNKRSPITKPSPRQAGQSLQEWRDKYLEDKIFTWLYSATAGFMGMVVLWGVYFTKISIAYAAWIMTFAFVIQVLILTRQVRRGSGQLRNFRLGIEGERTVGALLEDLRKKNYRIFHDIPGERKSDWNIDHVVIGPGGIFAFETKTYSKIGTPEEKIRVVNELITVPGIDLKKCGSDPIRQAHASADRIKDLLRETTGRKIYVKPVLLFPGWWVEEPPADKRDGLSVWVLSPKRLFLWLDNVPTQLRQEDIALYAQRLEMHINDCRND